MTPMAARQRSKVGQVPLFAVSLQAAPDEAPVDFVVSDGQQGSACSTSGTEDGEQCSRVRADSFLREAPAEQAAPREPSKQTVRFEDLPCLLGSKPRSAVGPTAPKEQTSADAELAWDKPDGGLASKIKVRNTFVHFSGDTDDEEEDPGLSRRVRTTRTVPARLFLESAPLLDEPDVEPAGAPSTPEGARSDSREEAVASPEGPRGSSSAGEAARAAERAAAAAAAVAEALAAAEAAAASARRRSAAALARTTAGGSAGAPPRATDGAPVPTHVKAAPPPRQTAGSKPGGAAPQAEEERGRTPKLRLSIRNTFLHVDEEADGCEQALGFVQRPLRRLKTDPPKTFVFDEAAEASDETESRSPASRPCECPEPCECPAAQEPPRSAVEAVQPPVVTASSGMVAPPSVCMHVALPQGVVPSVPGLRVLTPVLARIPAGQAVHLGPATLPWAAQQQEVRTASVQPSAEKSPPQLLAEEGWTTVVLKNLPLNYRRSMLLRMMDAEGFAGEYDYVYLPIDFKTKAGFGYAFVNLVDPSVVPRFWRAFDGYSRWVFPSAKVCRVSWSVPHQGLKAHIKRYRNSPLQHESVPDEYRPVLFSAGVRVAFPPPTKELAAPSQRVKALRGGRQQARA